MIGPFRGGRTRAATGVPSQPNVFYMGQVNGGVWKSDDYGRTWSPILDHESTQSIGAIAVAPSNPDIIYVASGEGLHRPDLSVGNGIYKSTDAGKTWDNILYINEKAGCADVAVDPTNTNIVYATTWEFRRLPYSFNSGGDGSGMYKSTDAGKTWTHLANLRDDLIARLRVREHARVRGNVENVLRETPLSRRTSRRCRRHR